MVGFWEEDAKMAVYEDCMIWIGIFKGYGHT